MKTGPDALGTVENESGSVKHEIWMWRPRFRPNRVREPKIRKQDPTPLEPLKMSHVVQNLKTGPTPSLPSEKV
jgi:hypothetical protein